MHVTLYEEKAMDALLDHVAIRLSRWMRVDHHQMVRMVAQPGVMELLQSTYDRLRSQFQLKTNFHLVSISYLLLWVAAARSRGVGIASTKVEVDRFLDMFSRKRLWMHTELSGRVSSRVQWVMVSRRMWVWGKGETAMTRGRKRRFEAGIPTYLPDELVQKVGEYL